MNVPSSQSTFVIFGASGGIGSELCRQLAQTGANVSLTSRSLGSVEALSRELGGTPHLVDVGHPTSIDACLDATLERQGRLDGVVNCIGSLVLKPAHLTTEEEWSDTIATNLTSSFRILKSAATRMMRSGGGSIVLLASAVALRGMINHEAIAAAKAGIVGLAQSAAATYAPYNVRVNCVAPGLTDTPLTASLTRNEPMRKASAALHPLGRIGRPADVASAIAWFLAPENDWVTGQVIAVDGGLSTVQPRTRQPA